MRDYLSHDEIHINGEILATWKKILSQPMTDEHGKQITLKPEVGRAIVQIRKLVDDFIARSY